MGAALISSTVQPSHASRTSRMAEFWALAQSHNDTLPARGRDGAAGGRSLDHSEDLPAGGERPLPTMDVGPSARRINRHRAPARRPRHEPVTPGTVAVGVTRPAEPRMLRCLAGYGSGGRTQTVPGGGAESCKACTCARVLAASCLVSRGTRRPKSPAGYAHRCFWACQRVACRRIRDVAQGSWNPSAGV